MQCDNCGIISDSIATITRNGVTANLCKTCGIKALKAGKIEKKVQPKKRNKKEKTQLGFNRDNILYAINRELEERPKHLDYKILNRQREGSIWRLKLEVGSSPKRRLDESYEGSQCWWATKQRETNGVADILSVIPERQEINIRFATAEPPQKDELIRIYPPQYLKKLRDIWMDDSWPDKSFKWLESIENNKQFDKKYILNTDNFPTLRERQAEAFRLLGWEASFLWGPPGTGKTFTIGAMLAQFILQFPNTKVLLLSTTNSAVDQALISVDKALESITKKNKIVNIRKRCLRTNNHFISNRYKNREHLLPVKNSYLIQKLTQLESRKPEKENVQQYAEWKQQVDEVQKQIKRETSKILNKAWIVAMTTTRAVFTFDDLRFRNYDLIVFDEASQVGIAHASALAPLAKRCLFGGDYKQLAPIVLSKRSEPKEWLGKSMFRYMDKSSSWVCQLNEQSRMSEPICDLVSNLFYDGELILALDQKNNPEWLEEHKVYESKIIEERILHLEWFDKGESTWSRKYNGPIRYKTAEFIKDLAKDLTEKREQKDILILTPFRAQRTLIRLFLRNANLRKIDVSTVHKAQGGERHTIIFDPVQGSNNFLNVEKNEDARRLVNVALSRAKARLIILLSKDDCTNRLFRRIYTVLKNIDKKKDFIPISRLINSSEFPHNAIGKKVKINQLIGRIDKVLDNGRKFEFTDFNDGNERTFSTKKVIDIFGNDSD